MKEPGPDIAEAGGNPSPDTESPSAAQRMGMRLFLASLAVLFAAGVVGYLVIRGNSGSALPPGTIELPAGLWASTAVLLVSGLTTRAALGGLRRGSADDVRRWLSSTWALAAVFMAIQAPCMVDLLESHEVALEQKNASIYGIAAALILIHALHVIGGMVPLSWLTLQALRHGLERMRKPALQLWATYWHFLEVVWIILLALFLFTT